MARRWLADSFVVVSFGLHITEHDFYRNSMESLQRNNIEHIFKQTQKSSTPAVEYKRIVKQYGRIDR